MRVLTERFPTWPAVKPFHPARPMQYSPIELADHELGHVEGVFQLAFEPA
jgi:hypothetical protein